MQRNFFLFFILSGISFYASGQSGKLTDRINRLAGEQEKQVIEWRRDIHQHPELGNREFRTADLIARHLRSLGMEVRTDVAHTGVVALLKGARPGPVIALRADMDALPVTEKADLPFASKVLADYNGEKTGVMHACGHDAHVAILMGVATVLAGVKEDLAGTVKFIFQPAEEGPPKGEEGGAALMVKEGVMDNPKVDVIFGLHMDAQTEAGKITYRPGGTMAGACDMKITVHGKPAHGAMPWSSVDPVVIAAQIVTGLQTVVSRNLNVTENAGVVTIGTIHGGNRFNIIPESVELTGTVRALSTADEVMMYERIRQIAMRTAEAGGATATVEIPYSVHYPVTFNDIALTQKMLPTLQKAAGDDNVLLVPQHTSAEDFSFYAEKAPGLYFFLGGMPKGQDSQKAAPHHTPEFFLDETGFILGVRALSHLVVDYAGSWKKGSK